MATIVQKAVENVAKSFGRTVQRCTSHLHDKGVSLLKQTRRRRSFVKAYLLKTFPPLKFIRGPYTHLTRDTKTLRAADEHVRLMKRTSKLDRL